MKSFLILNGTDMAFPETAKAESFEDVLEQIKASAKAGIEPWENAELLNEIIDEMYLGAARVECGILMRDILCDCDDGEVLHYGRIEVE